MRRTRRWLAAMRARRIRPSSTQTPAERQRRYMASARRRLVEAFGGYCWIGGENGGTPLEFAHRYPTGIEGRGRGSHMRLRDVRARPFAYMLVCRRCHRELGGPERWGPFPPSMTHPPDPPPEEPPGPNVPDDDPEDVPPRGPYQAALHGDDP